MTTLSGEPAVASAARMAPEVSPVDRAGRPRETIVTQGRGGPACGPPPLPEESFKVFYPRRAIGASGTFMFICKTVVLFTLKLYFIFLLLRYIYNMPNFSPNNWPARMNEIAELILGLAAVAAAESLWSPKSIVSVLSSRYFEVSDNFGEPPRRPGYWQEKFLPVVLFAHGLAGVSLYFASNICPWTQEGLSSCTLWGAFNRFFFINLLTISQAYIAMTIYTIFCLDVQKAMKDVVEQLRRYRHLITYQALSHLHWKWELCCQYLGDLNFNFLGFVSAWYCYLFVRAIYLLMVVTGGVEQASGIGVRRQEVCMPLFELSYLAILCLVSDKLKASLLSPVELLQDLTISRPTADLPTHVEVQRFLHRIQKYSSMTLWKMSVWAENALRVVVVVAIGLALWQDKRVRTRLLSLV